MSPRRTARASAPRPPARRRAGGGRIRALGQHFLRAAAVAHRIIELVGPTTRDLVVEIGPGRGALTHALATLGGRLLAIEVDPSLAGVLRARLAGFPHVEVLEADARHFDYAALRPRLPGPGGRVLIVGNLPYSVGKPILMTLIEAGPAIDEMALMLQKEVAERIAARPGGRTYGSLSVLTQMGAEVRLAFSVPPGAFSPPPQVDSAVVHLRVRGAPPVPVRDPARFKAIVRAAFGQRRKSLANALAGGLGIPAARARDAILAAGIDPSRRAETLSLAEFARLADSVPGR